MSSFLTNIYFVSVVFNWIIIFIFILHLKIICNLTSTPYQRVLHKFTCEINHFFNSFIFYKSSQDVLMRDRHWEWSAYCFLCFSPLIFNTTPLIIIFIIKSFLIYEIIHYYQKSQKKISLQSNPNARHPSVSLRVEVTDLNKKKHQLASETFKSHII